MKKFIKIKFDTNDKVQASAAKAEASWRQEATGSGDGRPQQAATGSDEVIGSDDRLKGGEDSDDGQRPQNAGVKQKMDVDGEEESADVVRKGRGYFKMGARVVQEEIQKGSDQCRHIIC